MANIVSTTLHIKNTNEEITSFFSEVILESGDFDEIKLVNLLFETEFVDYIEYDWCSEYLGSKSLHIDDISIFENGSIQIRLETSWQAPYGLLKKLGEKVNTIYSDSYIVGTYTDESYEPMGAFVFSNGFDEMEDLDIEIDFDEMFENDEYEDEIYFELEKLEKELEEFYKEHSNNR